MESNTIHICPQGSIGGLGTVAAIVTPMGLDDRIAALEAHLRHLGNVVVAFSGGADSAFLAAVAHRTLGDAAHAVTAVSPSLAGDEEADCRALATEWGLRWTPVVTHEMERAAYRLNDLDRCFHCKAELMDVVGPIAAAEGATVVLGVNLDDLGDHRPGQRAAAEAGAEFPLVVAGFTKADVRAASQQMGLRTWDKPAAACLASRIPYGTEVSVGLLSQVDRAESALRRQRFEAQQAEQTLVDAIQHSELARKRAAAAVDLDVAKVKLDHELARIGAEVHALVEKAGAVSPDLIAALQSFGDRALAERMAESMGPLAILGGESVADVLGRLLKGTSVANALAPRNP